MFHLYLYLKKGSFDNITAVVSTPKGMIIICQTQIGLWNEPKWEFLLNTDLACLKILLGRIGIVN